MKSIPSADPRGARGLALLRCSPAALVMPAALRCSREHSFHPLIPYLLKPAPARQSDVALAGTAEAQRQVVRPWHTAWPHKARPSNAESCQGTVPTLKPILVVPCRAASSWWWKGRLSVASC